MKMQKVLIIDDEPIIREGLKNVISWNEYGYEICGVGVDGRDGLNKIRSHQPDLILLDIRMPGLSGIDLVKQIRKENNRVKIIILTAYSSFSYAKELMGYGIESYLLKPIDEHELVEILEKISMERDEEKRLASQLELYNQLNEDKSLRALLESELDDVSQEVKERLEDKALQVARISSEIDETNDQWLTNEVDKTPEQIKMIRRDSHNHLLFIDLEESEVKNFLERVWERFNRYGDHHIVLMLGSKVDRIEDVVKSYHQVKELENIHFCFSEENILIYDELHFEDKTNISLSNEIDSERIFHYLEFNDTVNIQNELLAIEKYYQSTRYSKERIKVEVFEWTISMLQIIQTNYPSLSIISRDGLENAIHQQENLQAIIQLIYEKLLEMGKEFNGYSSAKGNIVEQVKKYIDRYYYKDITLKSVADLFHYNRAYLGKVFKRQTGDYFNVYLHKVRIAESKKLLLDKQYKVYEIAKQVGYSNSDYFYKNFKLYEGLSPKEYQMRNRV